MFKNKKKFFQMDKRLILTMIVKNENGIIQRCISSAKGVIDAICITDTGSTDDTVSLIETLGKELNIPTRVCTEPFKNFGHNRSVSFLNTKAFCDELAWNPENTFALHLDADMKLVVLPGFIKKNIGNDAVDGYNIIQRSSSSFHANHRLGRLSKAWRCKGRTHEYWECDNMKYTNFETLEIDDRNDGQSKSDKIPRDLRLLNEELAINPDDVRSLFYKGNTLKDQSNGQNNDMLEEAITCYKRRIELGGWDEELFYSQWMIGCCYEIMNPPKMAEALFAHLKAYEMRPIRAESLYSISKMYRDRASNLLSYKFAKMAKQIPMPKDTLFVQSDIYKYKIDLEISITGYYLGDSCRIEAYRLSDNMIMNPEVPDHSRNMIHRNIIHYLFKIDVTNKISLNEIDRPDLIPGRPEVGKYRCMNPSIIARKNDYIVNVRMVNYKQENGVYDYMDGSGKILTRNKLIVLDKKLNIVKQNNLVDTIGGDFSQRIIGLEDIRLVEHKNDIWFTTSTTMSIDRPEIALCQVTYQPDTEGNYGLISKTLLCGPKGKDSQCEKNWLPYSHRGTLYMIYQFYPFTILKWNESTKSVEVVKSSELAAKMDNFRGSGSPIALSGKFKDRLVDGYLSLTHEVHFDGKARIYSHRFVYHDELMNPINITLPFYFFNKGIEYVCGIALSHDKKQILITMGINDAEAYLLTLSTAYVKQLLNLTEGPETVKPADSNPKKTSKGRVRR